MGLKRTAGPSTEIIGLTELKRHLRVDFSDDDTDIYSLMLAAIDSAEQYTGRSFFTQTWEKTLPYFPEKEISLPRGPVQSVTSVKYYDEDNVEQTWDSSNYYLDNTGEISCVGYLDTGWPTNTYSRTDAIKVTYVSGQAVADVPNAVKHAIKMIVGHLYENRQDVLTGTQVNEVPMNSRYLLDPYKIYTVS